VKYSRYVYFIMQHLEDYTMYKDWTVCCLVKQMLSDFSSCMIGYPEIPQ